MWVLVRKANTLATVLLASSLGAGLAGCDGSTGIDPEGQPVETETGPVARATVGNVQYEALSGPGEPTAFGFARIEIRLRATNTSEDSVRVEVDADQPGCHYRLRAYAGADMSEPAAFDAGRLGYACTADLLVIELAPREAREYAAAQPTHFGILGDSLPEGTYHLSVAFRPNHGSAIELAAGAQRLER